MEPEDATDRSGFSRRAAKTIALSILAIGVASMGVAIPLEFANSRAVAANTVIVVGDRSAPRVASVAAEIAGRDFTQAGPGQGIVVVFLFCFVWLGVGTLIVSRQPTNWAGWIFFAVGMPLLILALCQAVLVYGLRTQPGSVPFLTAWALLGENALYPVVLIPLLFLLYPDGHVPGPRWRWAVRGLIGGTALAFLGFLLRPGPLNNWVESGILYVNPLGVDAFGDAGGALIAVGAIIAVVSALSTAVAVVQRFRHSTGERRQQMRVLALVGAATAITLVLQIAIGLAATLLSLDDEGPLFEIMFAITALTLVIGTPAAYLVAIFRHGLWDLDYVIKKTVQYGVVLAAFMMVGFIVVGLVPTLIFGVGADTNVVPVLALAGVLTGLFLWLRPRAARFANRLVYGKRATPYEVLSEFSERVGETYSTDDVLPRMAQLVADATGAVRTDVWLRVGFRLRSEASWPDSDAPSEERHLVEESPQPVEGEYVCEVRHQGDLLGAITLEPSPDDPINPSKEALVRDLAAQAGLVLRNVRLIEDLRASRQRLVAAQDEERRKLERNIHDGVQQQLVALSVKTRLADSMVDRDQAKAHETLAQIQTDTNDALETLRDLARGIYPPLLADQGLAAALQAQARKAAVPVYVEADGVERYPSDVEATIYFCVLEALNNVVKYADAQRVDVTLSGADGSVRFEVRDDGRGFDPSHVNAGTGIQGMQDRLDATGGSLRLDSNPGAGTAVIGIVPVGSSSD